MYSVLPGWETLVQGLAQSTIELLCKKLKFYGFNDLTLVLAWKSINIEQYPIQPESNIQGRNIRPSSIKVWKDDAKSKAASESVSRDTAKLWNNAPIALKNAPNLSCAKREIKKYCKSLLI